MIKHHPDDNLLAEFSAGSLDWALGLIVSAHIHTCPECKNKLANFNNIGAHVLSQVEGVELAPNSFSNVLARIEQADQLQSNTEFSEKTAHAKEGSESNSKPGKAPGKRDALLNNLPPVVEKLLPTQDKLQWKFVSPSLRTARLKTGQDKYEVAFHRISMGGKAVEHGHKGLELTLVLKGSFSDEDGVYREGDFLVRKPGDVHRPTATQNEDCLCFTVQASSVELTGLLGRLINPFLSIKPA